MVGRDHELSVLLDAYRSADSRPAVVVIAGEAGIGKSRLVAELLAGLRPDQAVCGSCLQLAGEPLPFAAIEDVWQQLARMTSGASRPASASAADPALSRLHQFECWLELIEGLADGRGPAVLVIEDLQWADDSTLAFLTMVARSLPRRRVMLVMTRRDDQPPATDAAADALAELMRVPSLKTLTLRRLTAAQAAELTLALRTDQVSPAQASPAQIRDLWDRSQGNPYLLTELAAAGGELPHHVSDVLLARVRRLHGDAQSLVRLAAVAGLSVDDAILWRASAMDSERYLAAVKDAVDAGVLIPESSRFVFRHSLTRDALSAQLLPLEVRRLHAAVAATLEASNTRDAATLAAIAVHWKVAGERQRAFPAACAAGRQSFAVHAYGDAWHHFGYALELADGPDPCVDRSALLVEAAEAARWSGDIATGVRLVRQALPAVTDRADQARLYERLGRYFWEAGDNGESHAAFSSAIELLSDDPDSPARPTVLAGLARASAVMTAYGRAAEEAAVAVDEARRAGLPEVEADALTTLGVAVAVLGNGDGAGLIRQALALVDPGEHLEATCRSYANLVFVLEHQGRHDEACDAAVQGLDAVGRHGLELGAGAALASNTAAILFNRGRYEECAALLDDLLGRGPLQGQALQLFIERAGLEVARGHRQEARASLQSAMALAYNAEDPWVVLSLALVEAELLVLEGHSDQAWDLVVAGMRRVDATEDDEIRARMCRLGLQVEADRLTARWTRTGQHPRLDGVSWLVGQLPDDQRAANAPDTVAECCTARAEAARAGRQDSPETWREAAELWRLAERPRDLAYCRLREAERAAERRLARPAAEAATEAHDLAVALGAQPIIDGVDALRRRAHLPGHRTVPAGPPPRCLDPSGLTGRELEVLELVAEGATNRAIGQSLYISERTAAVHVSSILRKLGVENRVQAAALAQSIVRPPLVATHS